MSNHELDPSLEVAHLRRLLDVQPSCLMRLGADGVVLAANDAALTLLGMTSHAQALGRDFAAWIPSDQQDRWRAFTLQVVDGGPASIECEVSAPNGDRQAVLFHGVSLTGHPDGVASMAVAARAVSGQRQLEAAVVEREELLREFEAGQVQARERLAEADAHRRRLEEKVQTLDALLHLTGGDSSPAPDDTLVRELRAGLEAREAALAEAVAARGVAEAGCDQALAECRRLETALEEFAARHAQVTTERAAERQRVLQMLDAIAVTHREELVAARNAPEWERLIARLDEREAEARASHAAREAVQAALEEARTGRLRLEADVRDAQDAIATLEQRERDAQDAIATLERRERNAQDTIATLEQREREGKAQRAALLARLDQALVMCQQYEAARQQEERAQRDLVDDRAALMADRDRLAQVLRERAVQLAALADEFLPPGEGTASAADAGAVPSLAMGGRHER